VTSKIHRRGFLVGSKTKGGGEILSDFKKYIHTLLNSLLDGMENMARGSEYRKYVDNNRYFIYSDEVWEQVRARNPNFKMVATREVWERVFKRSPSVGEKPFQVSEKGKRDTYLLDVSQTSGKAMPIIYRDISGEVENYTQIFDCLVKYEGRQVIFQEGKENSTDTNTDTNTGTERNSFTEKNGSIILSTSLSEQQIIFDLVREIIGQQQTSVIVTEAASYIVCRHLGVDTSDFTFGYLLELINFNERLKPLKDREMQDTLINEAGLLIGFLNSNLSFLQDSTDSGDIQGTEENQEAEENQKALEMRESTKRAEAVSVTVSSDKSNKSERSMDSGKPNKSVAPAKYTDDRIETVYGIDFRFIKAIKAFMAVKPDNSITPQMIRDYCYFDENMFIIGSSVAMTLFSKNMEVYILNKDNTEARAESLEDINKHHGLFGVAKDDWLTMQTVLAKSSLDNERIKIGRWEKIAVKGKSMEESNKNRNGNQNLNQGSANTDTKPNTDNRSITNSHSNTGTDTHPDATEVVPEINASGRACVLADDISHKDIENPAWVKPALGLLLDGKKYKHKDVPYFTKQGDDEPSYDMLKVNKIMVLYIANAIPETLKSCLAGKTEKDPCGVMEAVKFMCDNYNLEHIAVALKNYWPNLIIPQGIKLRFYNAFHNHKRKSDVMVKKPTPDESIRRVTALAGETAASGDKHNFTPDELELIHIFETYKIKESKAVKPGLKPIAKKSGPFIPPLLQGNVKAR